MASSGQPIPSLALAVKLASIAVHAEEMLAPGGHTFDIESIRSLLADAEVRTYLELLDAMALVPKKRTEP